MFEREMLIAELARMKDCFEKVMRYSGLTGKQHLFSPRQRDVDALTEAIKILVEPYSHRRRGTVPIAKLREKQFSNLWKKLRRIK